MSLGTFVSALGPETDEMLAAVFSQLPQKVSRFIVLNQNWISATKSGNVSEMENLNHIWHASVVGSVHTGRVKPSKSKYVLCSCEWKCSQQHASNKFAHPM